MLIVAGRLHVDTDARDAYLVDCREVVALARAASGCLDFALSADLLDDTRIDVFERWETAADLERFRGSGPDAGQAVAIRGAEVQRFEIASVGPA